MLSIKPNASATRYRVRVGRHGDEARMLTHLSQIEAMRRAVVASGVPAICDKRRRRQRPKLAFGPAISMGYESNAEYFDFETGIAMQAGEVGDKLAKSIPPGFKVLNVRRIPRFFPSLDASVNVVRYVIRGKFPKDKDEALKRFLDRREIVIEKIKDGGARIEQVDARPLIREMKFKSPDSLSLTLRFGPKRTVKPEALISEWLKLGPVNRPDSRPGSPVEPLDGFRILRDELFSETKRGELLSP